MTGINPIGKVLRSLWKRVSKSRAGDQRAIAQIHEKWNACRSLADRELKRRADELRRQWPTDDDPGLEFITNSFGLFSEALRRTLGISLYDVQWLAGLALSRRTIAEMQTGEGKTFAAALPALTFALASKGVHVMTVNAYLAERDCELLRPAFELLGVSLGLLQQDADPDQKRSAYGCDVTYGPGYEFGFDYLRDQLRLISQPKTRLGDSYRGRLQGRSESPMTTAQRGHFFAIVDEADSVMIDEALTPLILSSADPGTSPDEDIYLAAMRVADQLSDGPDYVFDPEKRLLYLTPSGIGRIGGLLSEIPQERLQRAWPDYVRQALRAKLVFRRDVDYIIDEDTVKLVDGNTGRVFANRSWRDGLRQAVEARQGVAITNENESVARISRQRYLRLYHGLCGLTGTATESRQEFWDVYRLPVVTIPLRTPSRRTVFPTRFFKDLQSKWDAVAADVQRLHALQRPVLVGTRTIEDSEMLAHRLAAMGLPLQLLNGTQDATEAEIIAQAGQLGAITVATNMAGRGTDIKLGSGIAELGGLHVVGCELNESARVDRQLAGRSARQGDPGSYQLFVSADDGAVSANSAQVARRMRRMADRSGEAASDLAPEIVKLQQRIEANRFSARRQLFAHDDWVENLVARLAQMR